MEASFRHCGPVGSAPAWDGTGCEFDSWQCRICIPCSLRLRLLWSFRGSLGTYGLTQKLMFERKIIKLFCPYPGTAIHAMISRKNGCQDNNVFLILHNFCIKPYVSREPRRNPSNRRLNEHGICIRHYKESYSQPVLSQVCTDSTRSQWRTVHACEIVIQAKKFPQQTGECRPTAVFPVPTSPDDLFGEYLPQSGRVLDFFNWI